MEFNPTVEEKMIKESARKFFEKELTKAKIQELQEKHIEVEEDFWQKIAKLGWLGLAFPEEYEGGELGLMGLAALYEECGRALMPTVFYSTMAAAFCIQNGGNSDQKKNLLTAISQGKTKITMAITEPQALNDLNYLKTSARLINGKYYLSGKKLFVQNTDSADYLIVAAYAEVDQSDTALTLFLVEKQAKGLTVEALRTFGLDSQSEVVLEDVEVTKENIVGETGKAKNIIELTLDQVTALQCIEMIGAAREVIKMTADYVKRRVQFSRPIGSFQAVQHHMTKMATDIEGAYYIAYNAIWRLSEGRSCAKEVSLAKAWISDAYKSTTTMAHQLHGGIGYTLEHDLYLYSNRAKTTAIWLGTSDYHYQKLADALGM
jgi:3-oxocholest-4-en-26-oyl-CoA dehydrogenase beta subunit